MKTTSFDLSLLDQLYQPPSNSHKGQNGKLLVIGGSKLFHASIFWSANIASRFVDMVHFTSPANENNDLVRYQIKRGFWQGIVVDWSQVEDYIQEDDAILIGPGMIRSDTSQPSTLTLQSNPDLTKAAISDDTYTIINTLLKKYPQKRWVIDGGALQEVNPKLLNRHMIITPHQAEWNLLLSKNSSNTQIQDKNQQLRQFSNDHNQTTILLKGLTDFICKSDQCISISGGNAGLTKGGTGDVLAGLTAAFYCKNPSLLSALSASYLVKTTAESLADKVGINYNADDLITALPQVFNKLRISPRRAPGESV